MKLVRDKIPQLAPHRTFRKATERELPQLVADKVVEEADEVFDAKIPEELTEELADLYTIARKLAEVRGISWDVILAKAEEKNAEKGEFNENWILLK